MNEISPKEGFTITKDELGIIINKKFPDFRAVMIELEHFIQTGKVNQLQSTTNLKLRNDLYSLIFDKTKEYDDIYHFIMNNFGPDKIDEMMSLLGRPFIELLMDDKRNINKLFEVSYIITQHSNLLETNTDPIILGMTVIGKIRDLF